jgi:hypothetical protein
MNPRASSVTAWSRRATSVLLYGCLISGCAFRQPPGSSAHNVSLGSCSPTPCVSVALGATPDLEGIAASDAVKQRVRKDIMAVLYASVDLEGGEPTPESLIAELNARLDDYKRESSAPIDWKLRRHANIVHSNEDVISVEVVSEGYLGAAHGFADKTLMTFDAHTGARMSVGDVVAESVRATLSKIVEAEFRRARSIPSTQSLQDAGFFILPGQEMPLAENFALTERGLELQYNPYEVGPYSQGATRVTVPPEAVEPLLMANLKGACKVSAARPAE